MDLNLYASVRNNPALRIDPTGTQDSVPDPRSFANFDAFAAASPKVLTQDYLMDRWAEVHGPVNEATAEPQLQAPAQESTASTPAASNEGGYAIPAIAGAAGIRIALAAAKEAYKPVSATGTPLTGSLNIFSGPQARASAVAASGYTIESLPYLAPALQEQANTLQRLGLPPSSGGECPSGEATA